MKKSYFVILAVILAYPGLAQKKPKINQANSAREKGELAEAKSIIDEAIVHEKTKDDPKTWYYRGLIYATIDTTSNESNASLSDNAMEEAMTAFDKANELDPEGKNLYTSDANGFPVLMKQQLEGYYSYYYNTGVTAFQDNAHEDAVKNFELAGYILPEDTNTIINAAYAAHNGELWDAAIKNYQTAIDKGARSQDLYYNMLNILLTQKKDNDAALAVIAEALKIFPNDLTLAKNKISILIEMGKVEEAKSGIESAIVEEPNNADLRFTLGTLYEKLEDVEKAKQAYKDAIAVNPKHFESNFNYGVLLINEATEIIKERNNLGMSKADQKKSKELGPVIEQKLKDALPQWERIYEIAPDDSGAIETLAYIYNQLGMKEKAKQMSDKL